MEFSLILFSYPCLYGARVYDVWWAGASRDMKHTRERDNESVADLLLM